MFLVAAVVGSGIAATQLSPGQPGLQLLINSVATGAALSALILALHPISASFNPIVTVIDAVTGVLSARAAAGLITAQTVGGAVGAVVANLMFGLEPIQIAAQDRGGGGLLLGEAIATLGLVLVVAGTARARQPGQVAAAVGLYIGAAYWFTSSTSFANPAVTIARTLSDTFAGIAPGSVAPFIAAQLAGGALALALVTYLHRPTTPTRDTPAETADGDHSHDAESSTWRPEQAPTHLRTTGRTP